MSHVGGIVMERCVSHAWHSYSAGIFKNSTQSLKSHVKGTFTAPQAIVYYTNPTLHNANGCTLFFSEQTRCTHLVAPLSDPGVPGIGDLQICPAIAQQEPNVEAAASASHHYRIKRCAPLKPKFFPTAKWSRLV